MQPRFADAHAEVLRQAREMGLTLTDAQITLCSIILYASWQDEIRDQTSVRREG